MGSGGVNGEGEEDVSREGEEGMARGKSGGKRMGIVRGRGVPGSREREGMRRERGGEQGMRVGDGKVCSLKPLS